MGLYNVIRRRVLSRGLPLIKRVALPVGGLVLLLHLLSRKNTIHETGQLPLVLPGDSLDPHFRDELFPRASQRPTRTKDVDTNVVSHRDVKPSLVEKPWKGKIRGDLKKDVVSSNDKPEDGVVPPRIKTSWSPAKANIPDMDKVRFKPHAITNDTVTLTLMSSSDKVFMSLNKKEIYRGLEGRGIHCVVLNEYSGRVMAARVFDTFHKGVEEDMVTFVRDVSDGRIIVFAVRDEASKSLTWKGRNLLKELGSRYAQRLAYRDMWALVSRKGGLKIAETYSNVATEDTGYEWGGPVFLRTDFDLEPRPAECKWPSTENNDLRRRFCHRFEGYGDLCSCRVQHLQDMLFQVDSKVHKALRSSSLYEDIGVAILATSKRPHILYRLIRSLAEAPGFNQKRTVVYIDDVTREIKAMLKLFELEAVNVDTKNISSPTVRIRKKVQKMFRDAFGVDFPETSNLLREQNKREGLLVGVKSLAIFEEDLVAAVDIFKYFQSLHSLLDKDKTVIGISAFSHHGNRNVASSAATFLRTDDICQLGILLPARTVREILAPNWPPIESETEWWEVVERHMSKGDGDLIIPEMPRVRHLGYEGVHIYGAVQWELFHNHSISMTTQYQVPDKETKRLVLHNYEKDLREGLKKANDLKEFNFCRSELLYGENPMVQYVAYDGTNDTHLSYVMNCLQTWNIYPKGGWRGVWVFHHSGHRLFIVGLPFSKYAPPSGVVPVTIPRDKPPK